MYIIYSYIYIYIYVGFFLHEKDDQKNVERIFAGGNQSLALCSLSQVGVFVFCINLFGCKTFKRFF